MLIVRMTLFAYLAVVGVLLAANCDGSPTEVDDPDQVLESRGMIAQVFAEDFPELPFTIRLDLEPEEPGAPPEVLDAIVSEDTEIFQRVDGQDVPEGPEALQAGREVEVSHVEPAVETVPPSAAARTIVILTDPAIP